MSKRRCLRCDSIKSSDQFNASKDVCDTCSNVGKCSECAKYTDRKLMNRKGVCRSCSAKVKPKTVRPKSPPIERQQAPVKTITLGIPAYNKEMVDVNEYLNINAKVSGIYLFYNEDKRLMYLGKAGALRGRIAQHIKATGYSNHTEHIRHNFKYLSYMVVENPVERDMLEIYLINELKPLFNLSTVYYENTEDLSVYFNTQAEER
jgi:hypothetical protein